jgi:hypothetical protein
VSGKSLRKLDEVLERGSVQYEARARQVLLVDECRIRLQREDDALASTTEFCE